MAYTTLAPTSRAHASLGDAEISPRLTDFLAGDIEAREQLPELLRGQLLRRVRVRPAYLDADLYDEVEQRTWELLLLKPASSFDSERGSAITYLRPIVQTAVRDVGASYAPPGCRTRPQRDEGGEWEERPTPLSIHDAVGDDENTTLEERLADPTNEIESVVRALSGEQLFDLVERTAPAVLVQALTHVYKKGLTFSAAADAVGVSRKKLRLMNDLWIKKQQRLGHLDPADF